MKPGSRFAPTACAGTRKGRLVAQAVGCTGDLARRFGIYMKFLCYVFASFLISSPTENCSLVFGLTLPAVNNLGTHLFAFIFRASFALAAMSLVLRLMASRRQYRITFLRSAASVDSKFRLSLQQNEA